MNLAPYDLHDGELAAFKLDRAKKTLELDFFMENGSYKVLRVSGLIAIRGADLTNQNIVNRVLLSSAKVFDQKSLDYWVRWITSLSDASSWLTQKSYETIIISLNENHLELAILEPSIGLQLGFICKKLDVSTFPSSIAMSQI